MLKLNEKVYVTRRGKVVYRRPDGIVSAEKLTQEVGRHAKEHVKDLNKQEKQDEKRDMEKEIKEEYKSYDELREATKSKVVKTRKYTHRRVGDKVHTKAGQKIHLNPEKSAV